MWLVVVALIKNTHRKRHWSLCCAVLGCLVQLHFKRMVLFSCFCSVAQSCLTLCDPMDCNLSLGFPRQEHWSGLPFPPPGDLPDPGIEPASPVQEVPLPLSKLGSPSGPTNPAAEVPWCTHWRRYGCLEEDCCNSCLGLVAQFTERVAHPWCPEESAGISQRVKLGLEFQAKEQPMWRVQRQDRAWCLKEAAPVCRGQDRSHSGDEQCACLCSAGLLVLPSF